MGYLKNDIIEGQELGELAPGEVKWRELMKQGIPGTENNGVEIGEGILQRHLLFLGAIGSGKSVAMYHLIEGLRKSATEDDVFVFFDAKGDYHQKFYQSGDYTLTNSLEDVAGKVHWNIFEDILASPTEKRDEVIWEIASSIFQEDIRASNAPIFAIGARDLFAAILCAKTRELEVEGTVETHETFITWLQNVNDSKLRNLLLRHNDLKWVRNYIKKENDVRTNQSFLMHLYQNLFSIFTGSFGKPGNFALTKAIQERGAKAVFLEYDIASAQTLKPIYTLLLDLAMKNVLGQKEKDVRGNVYFILDEFPLIPRLNYLDNALNFGRSLGMRVLAGIQNVGQIHYTYDTGLGNSILSGFGTVFTFRLFDEPSRMFVRNRHGMNKHSIAYGSSNASKGVQDAIVDGYVIEDWDITSLTVGECIVSPFNEEPFKFLPKNY